MQSGCPRPSFPPITSSAMSCCFRYLYAMLSTGNELKCLLLGKNIVARQWMLWLMSYCRARSPFVCSEPAGLKHPSCSPASPNGIRKRLDRFQYSVKEYLIWGPADSIKWKARWEGMSSPTGVIASELHRSKWGISICTPALTPPPPPHPHKKIYYTLITRRTLKGQCAISASVQISVILCCE